MEQLKNYLTSINIKAIDITKLLNMSTFEKYQQLAVKNTNVMLYFRRNKNNYMFFESIGAAKSVNYYFINKDNYLTYSVKDNVKEEVDPDLKRSIDNFLSLTMGLAECNICCVECDKYVQCSKCNHRACDGCSLKMLEFDKILNSIRYYRYKCLQCREYNEITLSGRKNAGDEIKNL